MQLYTIDTGYFKLDGGAMFGVVPKVLWSRTNPADANNLCSWAKIFFCNDFSVSFLAINTFFCKIIFPESSSEFT